MDEEAIKRIFKKLSEPFQVSSIKWRVQQPFWPKGKDAPTGTTTRGRVLAYYDARDVMDRLDEALGAGNLERYHEVFHAKEGNIHRSRIRIHLGPGVSREYEDLSDETDIEAYKGGASTAFKRAAVNIGVGRYLYSLGETTAAVVRTVRGWEIVDKEIPKLTELLTRHSDGNTASSGSNQTLHASDMARDFVQRCKQAATKLQKGVGKDDAARMIGELMDSYDVETYGEVHPKIQAEFLESLERMSHE